MKKTKRKYNEFSKKTQREMSIHRMTPKASSSFEKSQVSFSHKGIETKILWLAVEIIILVVATAALLKMMNAVFNPDKQITYANVQQLATKMNEACLSGGTVTLDNFQMPQPSPSKLWGVSDILPKLAINVGGDPQYVLYYEAFPPGEAIGWEVYEGMNYRVVAPIDDSAKAPGRKELTADDVSNFIKKVKSDSVQKIRDMEASLPDKQKTEVVEPDVIVPNIILDDQKKTGKILESVNNFPGTIGDWEFKTAPDAEDYYAFNNYVTLPVLDKSFVKYRACGVDSLCLKTREGIYRFPLKYCEGKIQTVQLKYDARAPTIADVGIMTGESAFFALEVYFTPEIITALGWAAKVSPGGAITLVGADAAVNTAILKDIVTKSFAIGASYRVSDFYIASPCTFEPQTSWKIEKTTCSCGETLEYPLYEYNKDTNVLSKKLDRGGKEIKHSECLDSITNGNTPYNSVPCIKITVEKRKNGFCWTSNPMVQEDSAQDIFWKDLLHELGDKFSAYNWMTKIAGALGGMPVSDSNEYYDGKIILKPTSNMKTGTIDELKKAWNWGWPGG